VRGLKRSGVSAERRKLTRRYFKWRLSAESRYASRGKTSETVIQKIFDELPVP